MVRCISLPHFQFGWATLLLARLRETFSFLGHLLHQEGAQRGSFSADEAARLVRMFQASDPNAFEGLVDLVRHDLWQYLVNQRIQLSDAEDLFQEVLLKLLQNLRHLKQPERFRSWLFAIALNQVRSFYRQRSPQSLDQLQEQGLDPKTTSANANRELVSKERLAGLRAILQDLPERERHLFLLDRFAGLQQAEIADLFELNLNTVKTLLRRTRIHIVKAMKEAGYV